MMHTQVMCRTESLFLNASLFFNLHFLRCSVLDIQLKREPGSIWSVSISHAAEVLENWNLIGFQVYNVHVSYPSHVMLNSLLFWYNTLYIILSIFCFIHLEKEEHLVFLLTIYTLLTPAAWGELWCHCFNTINDNSLRFNMLSTDSDLLLNPVSKVLYVRGFFTKMSYVYVHIIVFHQAVRFNGQTLLDVEPRCHIDGIGWLFQQSYNN